MCELLLSTDLEGEDENRDFADFHIYNEKYICVNAMQAIRDISI